MQTETPWIMTSRGKVPCYMTEHSAGFDIEAAEDMVLYPGEYRLVSTGLFLTDAMPACAELQIRPRSGLAYKNAVTVLNAPGTVDSDYRDEVKVLLINLGTAPFFVVTGMRIAQGVFSNFVRGGGLNVHKITRVGGFGSSGV